MSREALLREIARALSVEPHKALLRESSSVPSTAPELLDGTVAIVQAPGQES
jgi:hypothetical protein